MDLWPNNWHKSYTEIKSLIENEYQCGTDVPKFLHAYVAIAVFLNRQKMQTCLNSFPVIFFLSFKSCFINSVAEIAYGIFCVDVIMEFCNIYVIYASIF